MGAAERRGVRRLLVVLVVALFSLPVVAGAQSSLFAKPTVIVYPFTANASSLDREASSRLATIVATGMANSRKVTVVPPPPGTERKDFLSVARANHVDYYVSGFITPLGNGVAITAGGLVFTGAMDAYLRAFDAKSGAELWQGRLPVPGVANPMTYLWNGEQYVAIAAGGHSEAGTSIGDSVVAFRLARQGEAPSLWSRTIDRPGGRFWSKALALALVMMLVAVAAWGWRRAAVSRRKHAGGPG